MKRVRADVAALVAFAIGCAGIFLGVRHERRIQATKPPVVQVVEHECPGCPECPMLPPVVVADGCQESNSKSYRLGHGAGLAKGESAGYGRCLADHRWPDTCPPWTNSQGQTFLVCGVP